MLEGAHDDLRNVKSAKIFKTVEFVTQFVGLLITHNIYLTSKGSWLVKFINLYFNIISNCPVLYDQKLKYVDKLVVTKNLDDNAGFRWELSIKGHPVYTWNVDFPIT
jgi:hypothetical protein